MKVHKIFVGRQTGFFNLAMIWTPKMTKRYLFYVFFRPTYVIVKIIPIPETSSIELPLLQQQHIYLTAFAT